MPTLRLRDSELSKYIRRQWGSDVGVIGNLQKDKLHNQLQRDVDSTFKHCEIGPWSYRSIMKIVSGGSGGGRRCLFWYRQMKLKQLLPTAAIDLQLLHSHSLSFNKVNDLIRIWDYLKNKSKETLPVPLYNCFIHGLCMSGNFKLAEKYYDELANSNDQQPTLVTHTTMLSGVLTTSDAEKYMKRARMDQTYLSHEFYTKCISCFCRLRENVKAGEIMKEAIDEMKISTKAMNSLMEASPTLVETINTFSSMRRLGLTPNHSTFVILLNGLGDHVRLPGDFYYKISEHVFDRMKCFYNLRPTESICVALMKIYSKTADCDAAEILRRQATEQYHIPDDAVMNLVISCYVTYSFWEDNPNQKPIISSSGEDLYKYALKVV